MLMSGWRHSTRQAAPRLRLETARAAEAVDELLIVRGLLLDADAISEVHPRLRATRPDVADGLEPARVVERSPAQAEDARRGNRAVRDAAAAVAAEPAKAPVAGVR